MWYAHIKKSGGKRESRSDEREGTQDSSKEREGRYDREGIRKAVKVLDEKQKLKEADEKIQREAQEAQKARGFWSTFKFW